MNEVPSSDELGLDEVDAASADSMDASDPPAFGSVIGVGVADGPPYRAQRIADLAHEFWLDAGELEGRSLEFWLAAEREIDGAAEELSGMAAAGTRDADLRD